MMYSIFGNSKGVMTPLETKEPYPVGTVISKVMSAGSDRRFIVTSATLGHNGQPCIAEDLSMKSDVFQTKEKKHGGVGIGSFTVVPDESYTEMQVQYLVKAWNEKEQERINNLKAKEQKGIEDREAGKIIFEAAMPKGTKAVIIARLEQNESDGMSDYYGSKTMKTVIIAFSANDRNLFAEMRTAAAHFEPTKYLTEGDVSQYENREDYTGGGGYYLGEHRYSGWQVKKVPFSEYSLPGLYQKAANPETFQPYNAKATSAQAVDGSTGEGAISIVENAAKNGIEIHFATKPDQSIIDAIKANGGWRWHKVGKYWYIKSSPAKLEFANSLLHK